jgi:IMP dehydrogenase
VLVLEARQDLASPGLAGGLRLGMELTGRATIAAVEAGTRLQGITSAGLKESHAHDLVITKEAPNTRVER